MTTGRVVLLLVCLPWLALASPAAVLGAEPVVGDERAVPVTISQADAVSGAIPLPELIDAGRRLFEARFTGLDGAGRPAATAAEVPTRRPVGAAPAMLRTSGPDASACAGCHNQPAAGGAGDFVANVFVAPQDIEYDFDSVSPDLSMERGTTALHGAGLLELLAREMTVELHGQRDAAVAEARRTGEAVRAPLSAKGVGFGWLAARPDGVVDTDAVEGVHADLVVKPFGQKAVTISLRQFSVTAFNQHHGMQPVERFGPRWTGEADFDLDGVAAELSAGDVTAAVLFQATLPPPARTIPDHPALREAVVRGEALFAEIGCGSCHIPALPLDSAVFVEPGPYNPAGTLRDGEAGGRVAVDLAALWGDRLDVDDRGRLLVPAFTDLKRHVIADAERPFFANEVITQNFVPRDRFRTAPLWGVGATAPYGHRGDLGTLVEAIGHHGGEATPARRAFEGLPEADRAAVVEFLRSLDILDEPLEPERLTIAAAVAPDSLSGAAPEGGIAAPIFVDEAAAAGINGTYAGGWEHFVGGGVAVFDCDGDAYPDLYFAGGTAPARLYRNVGRRGGPLAFAPVDGVAAVSDATGAYPLDIDGDGLLDLVVLRVGENLVLRGLGGCRFEPANDRWGIDGGDAWTTAFSAAWEQGETLPTLAFGNYVDRDRPGAPFGTCHDSRVLRPQGDRYGAATELGSGHCALSLLFSDWNRDGIPDLRVSNDRQYYRGGQEQLFRFDPGRRPVEYTQADGWRPLKIWGMGIASHDLTRDGYPEYLLTSMADNKLQTLAHDGAGRFGQLQPAFEDIAYGLGATVHRPYVGGETRPSTAWHAEFDDVNNDGFVDLFIAKGNVEGMVDFASRDPNNLLIGQGDGSFREAAPEAGIVTFERARGAALADLNLDGLLDLVVVNREQRPELWRSLGAGTDPAGAARPMGGWSMIRLVQPGANPGAVGAWVEVKTGAHIQRRELLVGGGHAGGEAGWVHFGLGTSERLEVRVQWPDGTWGPWLRAFANRFLVVERDRERPLYWQPPPAAG